MGQNNDKIKTISIDDLNYGLLNAAESGNIELVKLFLKLGANEVNTAFHAGCGNIPIMKMLLANGANCFCNKCYTLTICNGGVKALKFLLTVRPVSLHFCLNYVVRINDVETVKYMLELLPVHFNVYNELKIVISNIINLNLSEEIVNRQYNICLLLLDKFLSVLKNNHSHIICNLMMLCSHNFNKKEIFKIFEKLYMSEFDYCNSITSIRSKNHYYEYLLIKIKTRQPMFFDHYLNDIIHLYI